MTTFRTFAPLTALVAFIAYSAIATASGGSLSFAALPLLVAGIGLLVWNARADEAEEAAAQG